MFTIMESVLRHRMAFPPEMYISICAGGSISVELQYVSNAVRMNEAPNIVDGWLDLRYENGEPVMLNIMSRPDKANWQERTANLSDFLFDATEPFSELFAELATRAKDVNDLGRAVKYFVRFKDPADFYRLLFKMCRLVAARNGQPVPDMRAFLTEWLDWWQMPEGEGDVPGQLAWYATHGPTPLDENAVGEPMFHAPPTRTQDEYDTEVATFKKLIEESIAALRRLQTELV